MTKIYLSTHAKVRLGEREISERAAFLAVKIGRFLSMTKEGYEIYARGRMRVIVKRDRNALLIVTAYRHNKLKKWKKHERKHYDDSPAISG
jgi:hypothetical protein